MNKKTIIFLLTSFLLITNPTKTYSQEESSESANTNKEEITEKIKERLEKVEIDNVLGTTNSENKTYAHFGIITEIAKSYLIVETSDKKRVEIKFNDNTELSLYEKGKANAKITPAKMESGFFAIAMGNNYSENSLNAVRISLSSEYTPIPEKKTVIGKVKEIDETSITLSNGQETKITIPKSYSFKIKGVQKPEFEDISINDKMVAIVELVKNKTGETTYELRNMYIIPSLNNPKSADNTVNEGTPSAEATESTKVSED